MRLALDTATRHAIVALGGPAGVRASVMREVVPGRGTPLLSVIDEALTAAGAHMSDIEAIGVGTGPGSFTGLRTGLATAKTLCWLRGLRLVALPGDETIRRAVTFAEPGLGAPVAVLLPAGARDHYLALPGDDPVLVPPSADLVARVGRAPVAALDLVEGGPVEALAAALTADGRPDPRTLGVAALARLPEALLRVMEERIGAGAFEDPATLVPRYVALPRGIPASPLDSGISVTETTRRDEAWSPTRP